MAFLTDVGRVGSVGASGALASLGRALRRLVDVYIDHRMRTVAEHQLRSMTDRELADIGVSRSEIHERVWH